MTDEQPVLTPEELAAEEARIEAEEIAQMKREEAEKLKRVDLSQGMKGPNVESSGTETFCEEEPEPVIMTEEEKEEQTVGINYLDEDWHFHFAQDGERRMQMTDAPCHGLCMLSTGGMYTKHIIGFAQKHGTPKESMVPAAVCTGCGVAKFLGPVNEEQLPGTE